MYLKIDKQNFLDKAGTYFTENADLFIYPALAELSGPKKIIYIEEYLVKNRSRDSLKNLKRKKITASIAKYQHPFQILNSLED